LRKRIIWFVVVLTVAFAPTAAYAATPIFGTGGSGGGGVIDADNEVLALFQFGIDGDGLQLDLAWWFGVQSEEEADAENPDCMYSGDTSEPGLSYIDLGRSLVIRVEGAETSCGTTVFAELEVIYRDSALDTSPIVDQECEGDLRRGVLRSSESAIASVYIETVEDGLIIEGGGDTGSAAYSLEQFVCVDTAPDR
jgi:hypothetical protein